MADQENGETVQEFVSPMREAYAIMHEMFRELVAAGFTKTEAMQYIIELGKSCAT